jgi:hypothetical protein
VSTDGSIADQPFDQEVKPGAIRDVFVGISLNPNTARAVATWLIKYADILESAKTTTGALEEVPHGEEPSKPH